MTLLLELATRRRPARPWWVVIALSLAAVLAACSHSPDPAEEHPLPTRDPADARVAIAALAGELHQQIAPTGKFTKVGVSEIWCEDPQGNASEEGPYSIRGVYQVFLPADQHRSVLTRLGQEWKAAGWTDVTYSTFGAEGVKANLKGTRPSDEVTVTLTSGDPPIAFALGISTPCYERPQ
ncbi:hypothetical protein [Cryptosporangium minutisporangium]|uniref:Uncharacterized protein n=1 Tax=Cryptosporangium minutisporangium TaxID=113569 RepID=A0ABP6SSS9_9ACTN